MIKVLFVCWGNICRSPMAEFLMKAKVEAAGLSSEIYVESAGTSDEEIGNGVHSGTRRILDRLNIDCSQKRARQIRPDDYRNFDYIFGMESMNTSELRRVFKGDPERKIFRMLDFTEFPGDVDDPWYTGKFDETYRMIDAGCDAILAELKKKLGK